MKKKAEEKKTKVVIVGQSNCQAIKAKLGRAGINASLIPEVDDALQAIKVLRQGNWVPLIIAEAKSAAQAKEVTEKFIETPMLLVVGNELAPEVLQQIKSQSELPVYFISNVAGILEKVQEILAKLEKLKELGRG